MVCLALLHREVGLRSAQEKRDIGPLVILSWLFWRHRQHYVAIVNLHVLMLVDHVVVVFQNRVDDFVLLGNLRYVTDSMVELSHFPSYFAAVHRSIALD